MRIKPRKLPKLEDIFELDEHFLLSPHAGAWRPALICGRRLSDGSTVVLKYWKKARTSIDADLRDLWRREVRHAERLRARLSADDLLVPMLEASEADDAFYVVMPGEWVPLKVKLRDCSPQHWCRGLQAERHRQILWRNLRRLVQGLDVIHAQRVVHGGLDEDVVFTASDHEADFRIGGFEWCFHVSEGASGPTRPFASSLTDDFASVGGLIARMLGLPGDSDQGARSQRFAALELSAREQALLRALMNPVEHGHFDRRRLEELLVAVENDCTVGGWGEQGRFILGVQLDGGDLPDAIDRATDSQIGRGDRPAQLSFMTADLAAGGQIVRHSKGDIWCLGECLAYKLLPSGPTGKEWGSATVRHAVARERLPFDRAEPRPLPAGAVELIRQGDVARRVRELGGLARDWSSLFDHLQAGGEAGADVRLGMLLTDVVLTVSSAVEAIPVEIVARSDGRVDLCAVDDDDLGDLRTALKIKDPARRMQAIFELEEGDSDGMWALRASTAIGGREAEPFVLTFDKSEIVGGQRHYKFRINGKLPADDFMYLSKMVDRNPHAVVQRRSKLLAALASQKELLQTLDRPESTLSSGGRPPLEEDKAFEELDESKQKALKTIWRRTPLQAVVGPPGVGKTHLLSDYVRRSLDEDSGRRILITAQGHQALDNAGNALSEVLASAPEGDELIVVRSKSERASANKVLYAAVQVQALLERVATSRLAKRAPEEHGRAIGELRELSKTGEARSSSLTDSSRELRSLETAVMQAATVLLSTTNSGELSRLVDSGAVFDEVIIEEAAKATGPELLAPMLLSMQRLLIGDHKQLPAFDSERLTELLGDVGAVAKVLASSEALVGALFRDHGLEELVEATRDEERLARICAKAKGLLKLFESIVRKDEDRAVRYPNANRLSVELTEQRRMHPVICDVVSNVFYNRRLKTSKAVIDGFANDPFPVAHRSGHIPEAPIIWVDLPYVQVKKGAGEATPTYHNPAERRAVLAVLQQMRAREGTAPSLAILSPYLRQAARLRNGIIDLPSELAHLAAFKPAATSGEWAGTVDSFQGSEADIVMVSLVRNNGDFGRAALGFVSDPRRMGVLLSRAKRQLILFGSYDFFCAQARRYGQGGDQGSVAGCIPDLMDEFVRLLKENQSCGTPKLVVIPSSLLTRGAS